MMHLSNNCFQLPVLAVTSAEERPLRKPATAAEAERYLNSYK